MHSLGYFKVFQEEERTSLGLQRIRARKGCILWCFKLFLHERREFFDISSYSRNKRLNSLILQAVSLREKEILCYFKLFEQEEVEFFDSSSYLCNKRLNSLVLQAIRTIKIEFFDSSSDSSNKGWILSLLQGVFLLFDSLYEEGLFSNLHIPSLKLHCSLYLYLCVAFKSNSGLRRAYLNVLFDFLSMKPLSRIPSNSHL